MRRRIVFLAALAAAGAGVVSAQSSSRRDSTIDNIQWVRRISLGGTFSVLPRFPLRNGSVSQDHPNVAIDASTTAQGHRVGGGGLVQVALPRRLAVAGSLIMHRSSHSSISDTYIGIDRPTTPQDERILTTRTSTTDARLWDINILVRRYSKEHFEPGPRWFYEAGPVLRRASRVRTSGEFSVEGADFEPDPNPANPVAHRTARGLTVGIGAQFVDDVGIRVVPEFRYTRFVTRTFDSLAARSRPDQLQALISITF
ncbi:MAG: hypothetical protein R2762_09275 [Bryobacteraceae bacterium]